MYKYKTLSLIDYNIYIYNYYLFLVEKIGFFYI